MKIEKIQSIYGKQLIILLLGTFLLSSCEKDKLEIIENSTPTSSSRNDILLNNFFINNQPNVQNFTVFLDTFPGIRSRIIGSQGTIISYFPGQLIYPNGDSVSGIVNFELTELYNKKDILFAQRPTQSNDQALVSGGAINLVIKQNGDELHFKSPYSMYIAMPVKGAFIPEMRVFNGVSSNSINTAGNPDSTFTWNLDSLTSFVSRGDTNGMFIDTSNTSHTSFTYLFNTSKLGWINCDYFYNSTAPKTKVYTEIPIEFDKFNTSVFVVIKDELSVLRSYYHSNNSPQFNLFDAPNIPIGTAIQLIVISGKDDDYYYSTSDHVVASFDTYTPTLVPTTEADLLTLINGL